MAKCRARGGLAGAAAGFAGGALGLAAGAGLGRLCTVFDGASTGDGGEVRAWTELCSRRAMADAAAPAWEHELARARGREWSRRRAAPSHGEERHRVGAG